jgi:hypothetical protein
MAFIETIEKNTPDSHQTSPGYVLTFIRYEYRDVYMYGDINNLDDAIDTRRNFVVVNDAIQVKVSNNKSNPVPTFSCVFKQGDINYLTAVHPGDYVTVNMLNFKDDAMKVRDRALSGLAINRVQDGFKGVFKVQDVRMFLQVDPSSGRKEYYVQVTGKGFDEFNNVLYFNPAITEEIAAKNSVDFLFLNNFANWADLIKKRETNNVQDLVKAVITRCIGEKMVVRKKAKEKLNQIPSYQVPQSLGALLNRKTAKYISQINNYYLGTWNNTISRAKDLKGFSIFFDEDEGTPGGNFWKTKVPLEGSRSIDMQDFQSTSVWSLLQDYGNAELNDMYTCYRVDPTGKFVYPSVVVRQKPFNTRHYEEFIMKKENQNVASPHTKFLDLPRWYIDPDLITSFNVGRSDAGRINFVQIYTRALSLDPELDQANQIVSGNWVEDQKDVIRNGRKPFIRNINYDFAGSDTEHRAKKWAYLVADWVMGGHLKMNGTLECAGIEKPICVGDNLELDNIVYHIESTDHVMNISPEGVNTFRTQLQLSMGVDKNSSSTIPVYAEMDHTDSLRRREQDYKRGTKMLPGFSDTQDLPSRDKGEEVKETPQKSFTNPKNSNKGKNK